MKRAFVFFSLGALLTIPFACTTSLDAIGSGGGETTGTTGPSWNNGTANVSGGVTTANGGVVATTSGAFPSPEPPCGLYYDFDGCEADATLDSPTLGQATDALPRAWRRCNDIYGGEFTVGILFEPNGSVFRMYRKPNPYPTGTENVVYCGNTPADTGLWSLSDPGEGGGGGAGPGQALSIAWDDGQTDTFDIVFYQGLNAFGLLHGPVDTLEDTERFVQQAAFIEGTKP
jgi:hypothetical protein